MQQIEAGVRELSADGRNVVVLGGDHTIALPTLRALRAQHGPIALVHFDAHLDTWDTYFDAPYTHGTPFRRAWEDGCLLNNKVVQIGLRGTGYAPGDFEWGQQQGWSVVTAEEIHGRQLHGLMAQVRALIGDAPVYLTFDIDSLSPGLANGTGTQEIGGLMDWQALQIVRGMAGLRLVGCDLVEVSPPFDPSGTTALTAANLLFEMLCVLPGVPQGPPKPLHGFRIE